MREQPSSICHASGHVQKSSVALCLTVQLSIPFRSIKNITKTKVLLWNAWTAQAPIFVWFDFSMKLLSKGSDCFYLGNILSDQHVQHEINSNFWRKTRFMRCPEQLLQPAFLGWKPHLRKGQVLPSFNLLKILPSILPVDHRQNPISPCNIIIV